MKDFIYVEINLEILFLNKLSFVQDTREVVKNLFNITF